MTCRFQSNKAKAKAVSSFLRQFGDDLPASAIREAVRPENLGHWQTLCLEKDRSQISSAGYWAQNDWYLCTLKNLATRPSQRGKGLATKVVTATVKDAVRSGRCQVLAADITVGNIPSQRVFEKVGFKRINSFCWKKGEKPANIFHYVLMPPTKSGNCH